MSVNLSTHQLGDTGCQKKKYPTVNKNNVGSKDFHTLHLKNDEFADLFCLKLVQRLKCVQVLNKLPE